MTALRENRLGAELERATHEVDITSPTSNTMGIDIYAHWVGQTPDEESAQCTGFSAVHGHVGYLREAYHGQPYATKFLVAEAFETGEAEIPASILRERLPQTLELVRERERKLYDSTEEETAEIEQSFSAFVQLCEDKEKQTGRAVRIVASY